VKSERSDVGRLAVKAACTAIAVGGLVAATTLPAEAVEKSQCVVYVDGIFATTGGFAFTARGSGVCSNAKNVTGKFLMRYKNVTGWHTSYNVTKKLYSVADGYDLGWHNVTASGTSDVYAEATVCYTYSGVKKCRSASKSLTGLQ
jgi:hypothetical protein